MSPMLQQGIQRFKHNRLGFFCLIVFLIIFVLSSAVELIANDKPLLVRYQQHFYFPVLLHQMKIFLKQPKQVVVVS